MCVENNEIIKLRNGLIHSQLAVLIMIIMNIKNTSIQLICVTLSRGKRRPLESIIRASTYNRIADRHYRLAISLHGQSC